MGPNSRHIRAKHWAGSDHMVEIWSHFSPVFLFFVPFIEYIVVIKMALDEVSTWGLSVKKRET